jgi:hypothetical protein
VELKGKLDLNDIVGSSGDRCGSAGLPAVNGVRSVFQIKYVTTLNFRKRRNLCIPILNEVSVLHGREVKESIVFELK